MTATTSQFEKNKNIEALGQGIRAVQEVMEKNMLRIPERDFHI